MVGEAEQLEADSGYHFRGPEEYIVYGVVCGCFYTSEVPFEGIFTARAVLFWGPGVLGTSHRMQL